MRLTRCATLPGGATLPGVAKRAIVHRVWLGVEFLVVADTVSPQSLGTIHAGICPLEQRVRRIAIAKLGGTNGASDGDRVAFVLAWSRSHESPAAFRDIQRRCAVDTIKQNQKFLATPPANEVVPAQRVSQHRRHSLEHFIACQMPIIVVDSLEVIDIKEKQRAGARRCFSDR